MDEQRIVKETVDFRMYEPEWVQGAHSMVLLQLCEELVEGRWEPFYATLAAR